MELDNKIICLYEEREQKKLDRKPLSKNRYYLIVLSEALKLVEAYKKYGTISIFTGKNLIQISTRYKFNTVARQVSSQMFCVVIKLYISQH